MQYTNLRDNILLKTGPSLHSTKMTIKQIINRLGGSMQIAVALGVGQMTVIGWIYREKIPRRHWEYFLKRDVPLRSLALPSAKKKI